MSKVIDYFKQINEIPRPSGKEEKMVKFLENYAKKHGFKYEKYDFNNIIIYKPAKNETTKTVVLQAHTDMVCEAEVGYDIDFEVQGIKSIIEGDWMRADRTSLGADDGIGVAMILALLENDFDNVNIEAVFTSEEETTMSGAKNLDCSKLNGKDIIGLDEDVEGRIIVASAGMVELAIKREYSLKISEGLLYSMKISGLRGGHSGVDIDKDRLNAIKLAFEIMSYCQRKDISRVYGGTKANVIPSSCEIIFTSEREIDKDLLNKIINRYRNLEPGIQLEIEEFGVKKVPAIDEDSENALIEFMGNFESGVINCKDKQVITSNNLAKLVIEDGKIDVTVSMRSSSKVEETDYLANFDRFMSRVGMKYEIKSQSPFFETDSGNELVKRLCASYEKVHATPALVSRVHAGLEGGVFAQKISGVNIVAIGPNIEDIHSTNEKVSVSSVERTYEWLMNLLVEY